MRGPSPPVKADSVSTSSLAPLDANSRLRVSPQGPQNHQKALISKTNVSSNQRDAQNMGVHTYHPSLTHSEPLCLGLWLKWVAIGIDHPEDPRHPRPILPRGEVVEPEMCPIEGSQT